MSDSDQNDRDNRKPELPLTGERLVPGAHPDHIVEAEHLARYEMVAAVADGKVVLDVACGAGYGSAILARAGAHSVAGIDSYAAAIAFAQDRYGDVARFDVASLLSLPFADDAFDLVVCFETIEHVVDPERALDELRRVTSLDGALVISTPNRGVYREDNPFHIREMTSDELREALAARFANVRLYRQQLHMASLITDDDGQAAADPGVEIPASLRKISGESPGAELYALAVAGDRELPSLPSTAVLSGSVAVRHWQDAAAAWEQRAREAEAERDANSIEVAFYARQGGTAREEAEELRRRIAASGRRGKKILRGE